MFMTVQIHRDFFWAIFYRDTKQAATAAQSVRTL